MIELDNPFAADIIRNYISTCYIKPYRVDIEIPFICKLRRLRNVKQTPEISKQEESKKYQV